MLTRFTKSFSWLLDRIVAAIAATGLYPGAVTAASVLLYLWAAILFAVGRFAAGGAVVLLAGLCDLLDGPLARKQGRFTLFAGFLDSILDRYADLILFVGLLIYYARVNRFLYAGLVGAALCGSVMVSYAQARAESLIPRCSVGFWKRPERVVLMIAGALANQMQLALWVLAIGANITVVHRILYTWKRTAAAQSGPGDVPREVSAAHASAAALHPGHDRA